MSNQLLKKKLENRLWRLNHLYKIKTKDKRLVSLNLNKVQEDYIKNETQKDIILKARQLGFSTLKLIEQLDYALTNENVSCACVAHEREKVQKLFEIPKLAFSQLPEELKPRVSYDNRNELYFPDLNSKIFVAMDTRAETVHNLHVSELAFVKRAGEKMAGILESVPKDGIISFESTANGFAGFFHETWEDPNSEFNKHFYNWVWDDEYRMETDKTVEELEIEYRPLVIKFGLIPDIRERFNLTRDRFAWYIEKSRRLRERVVQEYPTTDIEAFIASGRNVFNIHDLQKHDVREPIDRKYQDLLIWEHPLVGFRYTMGIDVAEGEGGDNASIEVLNAYTGEQVAEFAGSNIPPDILARYAIEIGNYYNKAFIVPEINGPGLVLLDKLKTTYYNIYRREIFDKQSRSYTKKLGWRTTGATKPLLVSDLEEAAREETIRIHSRDLIREMKGFVRTDESGKQGYGAEGVGKKDDRVVAIGLAVQGIKHLPSMKRPKTLAETKMEEYVEKKRVAEYFPQQKDIITGRKRPRQWIRK